ncbi:MAG: riboflavin synthase [Micromonosporaceae bacterium]
MFTGIVEELGEVVSRDESAVGATLVINGPHVVSDTQDGDSIAVNGVCLTVRDRDLTSGRFAADVMRETLQRSALGQLAAGDSVNLERAATLHSRLGGHLVQGHVDGVGVITERARGEREDLTVSVPSELVRYLVEKGSITVDGVSLTIVEVADHLSAGLATQTSWFRVSLIPTTLRATTLGQRQVGHHVNLEVDVIAKYVERLVAAGGGASGGVSVGGASQAAAGGGLVSPSGNAGQEVSA